MPQSKKDFPGPLNPTGKDGQVEIVDPPGAAMHMSAEDADLSGIRLMEAADVARESRKAPTD